MKTIIFTFALSLLCCICFIGCKDKDPTKPGYQNKAPKPIFYRFELGEAKSYLWSKPGSYWIYKNTKTNELDTFTCTGFKLDSFTTIGTADYSKHITIKYDRLSRNLFSSFNKWKYFEKTLAPTPDGTGFNGENRIILDRYADGSLNTPFFYKFINDAYFGTTKCIGMDTTLIIQGTTYYNVAKFEIKPDDIWHSNDANLPIHLRYPDAIYYWAKNVGLVKRENKLENYSWELIEHQIIK